MIYVFYGVYKNVRNAAWRCLIDFDINSLPTNVIKITDTAKIKVVKNSVVNMLAPNEIGASYISENKKKWHIVYNDTYSHQINRFTIAHELGHIFLGHELKQGKYTMTFGKSQPKEEREANSFAYRLLSPACVIWALDLHQSEEIAELCDIENDRAKIRAARMKTLYERNKFLLSKLERKVYKNFEDFIKTKRKRDIVSQYNKSLWG